MGESMKPEEFKSLIKELGSIVDARAKTTEMVFQAEIRASEERVTNRIEKRIDEAKEELRAELATKEQVATVGIAVHNVEVKLTQKVNKHERRIENLEEKTKTNDPTKH
jgi:vacuolar-type H+-ATPase subunit I/STV1